MEQVSVEKKNKAIVAFEGGFGDSGESQEIGTRPQVAVCGDLKTLKRGISLLESKTLAPRKWGACAGGFSVSPPWGGSRRDLSSEYAVYDVVKIREKKDKNLRSKTRGKFKNPGTARPNFVEKKKEKKGFGGHPKGQGGFLKVVSSSNWSLNARPIVRKIFVARHQKKCKRKRTAYHLSYISKPRYLNRGTRKRKKKVFFLIGC